MLLTTILLCFSVSSFLVLCYHMALKSCSQRNTEECKNSPCKALDPVGKLSKICPSDFDESSDYFEERHISIRALAEHSPAIIPRTVRKRSKLTQNRPRNRSEERTVVRKTKSHADLTAPVHNATLQRR
ncbi:unnamed protein product [Acanthoscelides obtectus]|nr:unnamed protein product [Acanthoscelides obtectus]CAK1661952.1 hypothetical protein AOBTE_LOCUS22895 [Acanthoscelides obtectus]